MPLPLRTRVLWQIFKLLDGAPVMQQPAETIRVAADKRIASAARPYARPVVGRPDRGARASETTMTTADGAGPLPVRIHRPVRAAADGPLPVVVNFHGGGFVSGNAYQSEWWCSSLAARAGVVVVSVDYRLAPENRYPVAVEDCYAALQWTVDQAAELGVDPARLAVMGDSAGGNLAAVVAMVARDRGGPAIALQVLLYPAVDFLGEYPSERENATAPVLGKKDMDHVPNLYFAPGHADRGEPYASPLRGRHDNLPPALIQTAEYDPLRDQGAAYATALRAAGVAARYTNYVGAVHGYISIPGMAPAARQALSEAVTVLSETFAPEAAVTQPAAG